MKYAMPALTVPEYDKKVSICYHLVDCHMIIDVKMDLTQKAQYVAVGRFTCIFECVARDGN